MIARRCAASLGDATYNENRRNQETPNDVSNQSSHAGHLLERYSSMRQIIALGDDYPSGVPGELAVCYYLSSETHWAFIRVPDRQTAEKDFKTALAADDVLRIPLKYGNHKAKLGAVVWLAKCDGKLWCRIKETEGALQYLDRAE